MAPVLPPYEAALLALDALGQNAMEDARQYYFKLNLILRQYISLVFKIHGTEMTSQEFGCQVRALDMAMATKNQVVAFQDRCDPIKYAGLCPDTADVRTEVVFIRDLIGKIQSEQAKVEYIESLQRQPAQAESRPLELSRIKSGRPRHGKTETNPGLEHPAKKGEGLMFRFASPWFLVLLGCVVPALVLWFKPKRQPHIQVACLDNLEPAAHSFRVILSRLLPGLKIAALILVILALARPQWGDQKINVTTQGVNIILALDLSESMRALDFKRDNEIVTRLEAVKTVVGQFIMKREGDRIGMVVFGSNAFTQLPLTRDYNTISFILDRLQIGAAGPRTAIGDAIGISLKRLEDIKSKSNIIILITDGKSNSGELSWQDAARIAAERKVKVYTIGVGTKGAAPLPGGRCFW